MKRLALLALLLVSVGASAQLFKSNSPGRITFHLYAIDGSEPATVTGVTLTCSRWTGAGTRTDGPCTNVLTTVGGGEYSYDFTATELSEEMASIKVVTTEAMTFTRQYNTNLLGRETLTGGICGQTTAAGTTSSVATDLSDAAYVDGFFATGYMRIAFTSGVLAGSSYQVNSWVNTGDIVGWRPPAANGPGSGASFCIQ